MGLPEPEAVEPLSKTSSESMMRESAKPMTKRPQSSKLRLMPMPVSMCERSSTEMTNSALPAASLGRRPDVCVVARRCQTPPTGAWSPRARGPWRAQLMTPGAEMPSMHLQVSAPRARRRAARALLPWVPLAVRRRLALRGERAAAGAAVVETGGPCATVVHRLRRGGPLEGWLRPVRGSYRARSGPSTIDDVAAAAGGRSPST